MAGILFGRRVASNSILSPQDGRIPPRGANSQPSLGGLDPMPGPPEDPLGEPRWITKGKPKRSMFSLRGPQETHIVWRQGQTVCFLKFLFFVEYKDVKQSMTTSHACRGQAGTKNHDVAGKETKGNGRTCREMESTGPPRGIANWLLLNSILATLLGSGFSRFVPSERRKRDHVCKHFCGEVYAGRV